MTPLKFDRTFSIQSLIQTLLLAGSIFGGLIATSYKAGSAAAHFQSQHAQIIETNGKILDLMLSGKCK